MTESTTSVAELHFDHEVWTFELKSWREELKILEKYLTKIQHAKLNREATVELERFQNQFIRHKEVIHDLINEASSSEKYLVHNNDIFTSDEIRQVKMQEHAHLEDQIQTARKIYSDLKLNFRNWLINRL
jgi:hypothetical protein